MVGFSLTYVNLRTVEEYNLEMVWLLISWVKLRGDAGGGDIQNYNTKVKILLIKEYVFILERKLLLKEYWRGASIKQ